MAASMVRHAFFIFRRKHTSDVCYIAQSCANVHVRGFSRILRRMPLRTLTQKEADNLAKGVSRNDNNSNKVTAVEPTKFQRESKHRQSGRYSDHQTRDADDSIQIPFTKLGERDERFGQMVATAKSRVTREKKGLILLEGHRLICDAIESGVRLKALYFSKVELLQLIPWQRAQCDLYKVQHRQLKLWSDVVTPSGVMAVCHMPKVGELTSGGRQSDLLPITLICDNVRDPGNMGTLLRTAAAVGCQKVLVTKGCVDIWEPKVLRAGAGAHFRLHLISNVNWELVGNYLSQDSRVYLADNNAGSDSSPAPSRHDMEKIASVDASGTYTHVDEETYESYNVDPSYLDEATVKLFSKAPLPTHWYSDVDYTHGGEVVIVVGGETEGLGAPSRKLAFERNGDRINIPMTFGVESLNSGVAASVILFEVKRQLARSYSERTDDRSRHRHSSG